MLTHSARRTGGGANTSPDRLFMLNGIPVSRAQKRLASQDISDRPLQRMKTTGANSRFNRMIETVNTMHTSPQSHSRSRRARAASSSSASAVSYDEPRTPVDAYSGFSDGRLGNEFSVIKLKERRASAGHSYAGRQLATSDLAAIFCTDSGRADRSATLPAWLCDTVVSLDAKHPLRVILPPTVSNTTASPSPIAPSPDMDYRRSTDHAMEADQEESVFAFSLPLQPPEDGRRHSFPRNEPSSLGIIESASIIHNSAIKSMTALPSPYIAPDASSDMRGSTDWPPFSTPGPASMISASSSVTSAASIMLEDLPADTYNPRLTQDSATSAPFLRPGPLAPKHADSFASTATVDTILDHPDQSPLSPILSPNPDAVAVCSVSPTCAPPYPHIVPAPPFRYPNIHSSPSPDSAYTSLGHAVPGRILNSTLHRMRQDVLAETDVSILYSTPGPAYNSVTTHPPTLPLQLSKAAATDSGPPARASPFKVYFDSPAEDPCASDSLEENEYALALDYDVAALGFKWEKFTRGGGSERIQPSTDEHPGLRPDEGVFSYIDKRDGLRSPHTPLRTLPPPNAQASAFTSSSPPSLPVADDDGEPSDDHNIDDLYADEEPWILPSQSNISSHKCIEQVLTAPSSPVQGPSFAPAPGIFLSPLRGEADEEGEQALEEYLCHDGAVNAPHTENLQPPAAGRDEEKAAKDGGIIEVQDIQEQTPSSPDQPTGGHQQEGAQASEGQPEEVQPEEEEQRNLSQISHDTIESWSEVDKQLQIVH